VVAVLLIAVLTYFLTLTTRPEISLISPQPYSVQEPGKVEIAATVRSQRAIDEAIFIIDGDEITPEVSDQGDSQWRIQHEQVFERGEREIVLQITDSSGRTAEHSWSFESRGDLIEPRLVIASPPSDSSVAPGDNGIVVQVTTFADIGPIEIMFDGSPVNAEIEEIGRGTEYSNQDDLPIYEWIIRAEARLPTGSTEVDITVEDEFGAVAFASWAIIVAADEDDADARFFRQTGEYIAEPFLSYWIENNGATTIGPPIAPPISGENAEQLQFFRFARLELDANGDVQRGLIGREMFGDPENPPDRSPGSGARQFEATGHYIIGTIRDFWEDNGELAVFGYPVSQEFETQNGYAQYFERALIEVIVLGSYEIVELAPLGERLYESRVLEEAGRVSPSTDD
jgi:hypothetical protein